MAQARLRQVRHPGRSSILRLRWFTSLAGNDGGRKWIAKVEELAHRNVKRRLGQRQAVKVEPGTSNTGTRLFVVPLLQGWCMLLQV
jgi:hypothetical protein